MSSGEKASGMSTAPDNAVGRVAAGAPATATTDGRNGSAASPAFVERDVSFDSGALRLAGTLTLPAGAEAPWPAALLLVGSGPVDRNENWKFLRVDATRQLAHALAAAGIASLRYDKRGVGASEGGDWRAAGFFDAVDDAAAACAFLGERPEVDPSRVAAIGHSEGALTATALAGRGEPLAAIVLLAGSAVPGTEVGRLQAERIIPTLPAPIPKLVRLLRIDLDKRVAKSQAKVNATTGDIARVGLRRVNARWTREFLAYDPAVDLARCRVPVLALTGGKDLQIDPDQLDAIRAALAGPVTISRPAEVTHTLRRQPGKPSLLAYRKELRRPVDPDLLTEVVGWTADTLDARLGKAADSRGALGLSEAEARIGSAHRGR